ncbi:nucleotidyltransferase domain-containing protein [Candidatus Gottesmanbacteria bacterium]|nr:nucleotidyltransferase domain-containing protein [Candidatus Gottesmanbacteria bacterium]
MITNVQKQKLAAYFAAQPVDAVYLFGSQATGKDNSLSDVDIAVLFREGLDSRARSNKKIEMIGDVGSILKRNDVEILDLDQAPPVFRYQAIAPKNTIYSNNITRMVSFEMDAIQKYFDLRPLLAFAARRKLALLAQKGFLV